MRPNPNFLAQTKEFWAHIRTISQQVGYTQRGKGAIKVPTLAEIRQAFLALGLNTQHLVSSQGAATPFGQIILDYFSFRACALNEIVQAQLMDRADAERHFLRLKRLLNPSCPLPMNKQSGDKKNFAFFTGIVNMLIESGIARSTCDYDPRVLTTVTRNSMPLRTLARRVDGAFPAAVNPIAIWEIKEYYYTTTFGSRVADGVYETLLDGMELEELKASVGCQIDHVLFVDGRYTWWECGRSYLCRMIDMLHMGYVDEVIFGREAIDRLPLLTAEWVSKGQAAASTE